MSDIHGTREELVAMIAGQSAEIARLQGAKRRALAIADERSLENVALRQQMARINKLPELRCDDCDNGVEVTWQFCPWCASVVRPADAPTDDRS